MLTEPSAIHPKQAYPWSMALQREAQGRSPDPQPLHQRGFDPCKLLHGSQAALDSQGSCQPGQRAGGQDGWRTGESHSKLVVLMRWTGRGSTCLCQGEWNGCLPAGNRKGGSWAPVSLQRAKVQAGSDSSTLYALPEPHGHGSRESTRGQGLSSRASRHMGHLVLQTVCGTAGATGLMSHVPANLSTSTPPWESVSKQEKHTNCLCLQSHQGMADAVQDAGMNLEGEECGQRTSVVEGSLPVLL